MDRERLRERIAQRAHNAGHAEVCRLLVEYGWTHRRTTASHYIFGRDGASRPIPVPFHGATVPAFVVRQVLKAIDEETDSAGVEDVET